MNIDNKIKILDDEINLIKGKYLNQLNLDMNKKEDDIKNIINERDNNFKEMNIELLNEFKKINQTMEKNILNAINSKYEELKLLINNIDDNLNEKELNNLIVIKKVALSNKYIDKNIEKDLNNKINEVLLNMLNKSKLKNSELLDYIENNIYKFCDLFIFRVSYVLNGIDLETADENFFEKWNKINPFKLFSLNDYEFKSALVNKVNNMKDFGKLLRLFNYKDNKIFDINTMNLLCSKFKNLMKTYKIETCQNFVADVSFYIYINDQINNQEITKLMVNIIEKYIKSFETLTDIYIYLTSNYRDISKKAINHIINFFMKNTFKFNSKIILFLLKNMNNEIEFEILSKIDNYIIKEEEIFSVENEVDSFKLLQGILYEANLYIPELEKYKKKTILLSQNFLKKIKNGEINYISLYPMWNEKEKKTYLKKDYIYYFITV